MTLLASSSWCAPQRCCQQSPEYYSGSCFLSKELFSSCQTLASSMSLKKPVGHQKFLSDWVHLWYLFGYGLSYTEQVSIHRTQCQEAKFVNNNQSLHSFIWQSNKVLILLIYSQEFPRYGWRLLLSGISSLTVHRAALRPAGQWAQECGGTSHIHFKWRSYGTSPPNITIFSGQHSGRCWCYSSSWCTKTPTYSILVWTEALKWSVTSWSQSPRNISWCARALLQYSMH